MKEIYALGIGHNTPVFIDIAEAAGYAVKGLYHYNNTRTGEYDYGYPIIGSFDDLLHDGNLNGENFLLTMGDSHIREDLTKKIVKLGGNVPTIIHPTAVISKFAKVSDIGVYVNAFVHIQADSTVDEGSVFLTGTVISHTNRIGRYCFFAEGVTIGAYTEVKDFTFVGQGALSISAKVKTIGPNSLIGARALLTQSVPPNTCVKGIPAKAFER